MSEPTTHQVVQTLSSPADSSPLAMHRRSFLLAAAAGITVATMPKWLGQTDLAKPIGASDGVMVLLTMGGGNDGLNTVVPFTDGAYYDARGSLAIARENTLPIDKKRGFNSNLPFLKSKWDANEVALIDGVGAPQNDLSHFTSMANWMKGSTRRTNNTGWVGRYIDNAKNDDPFHAVAIDTAVPLLATGAKRRALAIPHESGSLFLRSPEHPHHGREYDAIKTLAVNATGSNQLQKLAGKTMGQAVDLSDQLLPIIGNPPEETTVVTKLRLAAKLINANLGVRVISIVFGDFDSHANQPYMHNQRMIELNQGLSEFYETLNPTYKDRSLVLAVSEFGRRVNENGSQGTDHGSANTLIAIGSKVNGGVYGQQPSLTDLDSHGNTRVQVDYRNVYSDVLTTWLNADSAEIVGTDYPDLGFLSQPGKGTPDKKPDKTIEKVAPATHSTVYLRRQIARLYQAYFGRKPDEAGAQSWLAVRLSGQTLGSVANDFALSKEFKQMYGSLDNSDFVKLCYKNILGRDPDKKGLRQWTEKLAGDTTRGDVMVGFSESPEYQKETEAELLQQEETGPIGRLYRAYFNRRPDTKGLHGWINANLPTETVSQKFTESEEFQTTYGQLSNSEFVDLIYQNVLGRKPDKTGKKNWNRLLTKGKPRGEIMVGFSNSLEFRKKVNALYD